MRVKHLTQACAVAILVAAVSNPALSESTNSKTFEGWANDTAVKYQGRIPRDVYLDEMGRRWDADSKHQGTRDAYLSDLRNRWNAVDTTNRGLSPAEAARISGNVDSNTSATPKSGSGVQPGNMGPGNAKGQ